MIEINKYNYMEIFITLNMVLMILLLASSHSLIGVVTPIIFLIMAVIHKKHTPSPTISPFAYSFLLLVLYTCSTCLWALDQQIALEKSVKIILLLLPISYLAMTLNNNQAFLLKLSKYLRYIFALSLILIIVQLQYQFLIEDIFDENKLTFEPHVLNSGASGLIILFWLFLYLQISGSRIKTITGKVTVISVCILMLVLLFLVDGIAPKISFFSSLFVLFASLKAPKRFSKFLKTALIISLLVMFYSPGYLYEKLEANEHQVLSNNPVVKLLFNPSNLHRIDIWDRSVELFLQKPIFGWGVANTNKIPQEENISKFNSLVKRNEFLYPHNIYLQVAVESGFIGILLLMNFLFFLINLINSLHNDIKPFAFASFIGSLTIVSFGFPVWRSWWIVLLGTVFLLYQQFKNLSLTSND